jgi:glycerol-3-phosphate acyltransferase PlsX
LIAKDNLISVAVDLMGGDNAPREILLGALSAAKNGVSLLLCGDKSIIQALLDECCPEWSTLSITLIDAPDRIKMEDEPVNAVMHGKNSSLVRAVQLVAQGRAQAIVSAGNSGALLVASTLYLGRVPGVLRPAIGGFLPGITGSAFCIDLGANVDCKVDYLEQFAYMGHLYVRTVCNVAQPRIGLISNGHEAYKGSALVKRLYKLLEGSGLCFVGNVEARDIFDDAADVLVCDGFVGNVMLKAAQGTVRTMLRLLEMEGKRSIVSRLVLGLSRPIVKKIKEKMDYARSGGALLLGVQHPVIVMHGSSRADAVVQAINFAVLVVHDQRVSQFNQMLAHFLASCKKDNVQTGLDHESELMV